MKDLKDIIGKQLGDMPASKQQLKNPLNQSFLKDTQSLAAANIGDGFSLELSLRSRGGKK